MLRAVMRRSRRVTGALLLAIGIAACVGGADPPPQEVPAAAVPASGPAAEAAGVVQQLFDEAAAITGDAARSPDAKRADLERLIEPILDYPSLARAALGPRAERFSPAEYGEFSREYGRYVTELLVRRFAAYPGQASRVDGASYDEQSGVVNVAGRGVAEVMGYPTVRRQRNLEPIRLDLALRERDEEWRVVGVKRGEVDVSRSFREQFAERLERSSPAEVIAELRQRNRELAAENPFATGS